MPVETPILTEARQSVWDAIDNWPILDNVFKKKWKFEDNAAMHMDLSPTIGDMPSLAVYPVGGTTAWATNQQHDVVYPLEFQLWTRHWNLLVGEEIWQDIMEAMYQSKPLNSNVPYVHQARRKLLELSGPSAQRVVLADNRNKATLWKWVINLSILTTLSR